MKRELLTDTPKLGALSSFIELLNNLQDEFELQTISIGSTDSDNRNMYAELTGEIAIVKLDYEYYDEKCYISIVTNYEDSSKVELMKKSIKDFIEKK